MLINFDVSTDLFVPMREDDEKRRWYYASAEPRVVLRLDGFSIDEIAPGEWCDGLVGWDRGDAGYVLPQNVGLRHTKITLKAHDVQAFDVNTPPQDLKTMSEIMADAPRNRRFERVTRVTITTHEEAELDDPVTVSEAALMLFGADGARELMRINRLIESGVLQEYVAANEPNPRRARRLSRSDVQAYKRTLKRSQRK